MTDDAGFEALMACVERRLRADPEALVQLQRAYAARHPVAVAIAEALRSARPPGEALLRARYGLTRQEARVAAHLIGGGTVASCAEALEIAPATVRSHLKTVFAKTGVRRQAALAGLGGRGDLHA